MMPDDSCEELDDFVDLARERIAAVRELVAMTPRIREDIRVCQICLQPSERSVCDGCEYTGGLYGDLLEEK